MTRAEIIARRDQLQQQAATLNDQFHETLGAIAVYEDFLKRLPEETVQAELLPVKD